jgi:hypothetical protein
MSIPHSRPYCERLPRASCASQKATPIDSRLAPLIRPTMSGSGEGFSTPSKSKMTEAGKLTRDRPVQPSKRAVAMNSFPCERIPMIPWLLASNPLAGLPIKLNRGRNPSRRSQATASRHSCYGRYGFQTQKTDSFRWLIKGGTHEPKRTAPHSTCALM